MLEQSAQEEFTRRLSEDLRKNYWEIVSAAEAKQLRQPHGPGVTTSHFLLANFVLKSKKTQHKQD